MGHWVQLDLSKIDIIPTRPRHERLTADLERRARAAHRAFLQVILPDEPFEVFQRNLLCDVHPDREVAVTETMALALDLAKPGDAERLEAAKLILWLSMVPPDIRPNRSQFALSRRVIHRVVAAWKEAKKQIGMSFTAFTLLSSR